jgi:hypothetical protein
LLKKKGAIRSLLSLVGSSLFLFLLEAVFAGYIPSIGLFPSPASTFACSYIASTITTSFSILVYHNFLH